MTAKARNAVVYCRLSDDPEGTRLGIDRQEEDGRREAERRGWAVAGVEVDRDLSAYSGVQRPAYERVLAGMKDGTYSAVVVYNLDRLHRRPKELEDFIELAERHGVLLASVAGDVDLSTPDGRLFARLMGAADRAASEKTAQRVRRAHQQLAAAGKAAGGGLRPYGYTSASSDAEIVPEEATIIREAATRVLAGDSLHSVTCDLNARGVLSARGNPWRRVALRRILLNPRQWGVRVYKGASVKAVWPPILTSAQGARLTALLTAGSRRTHTQPIRRYPLRSVLRCGVCGGRMYGMPSNKRDPVYACRRDHAGCGQMSVSQRHVEAAILDAIVEALDSPAVAEVMAGKAEKDAEHAALADSLEADRAQMDELASAYAERLISMPEWLKARSAVEARIEANTRRISAANGTSAIEGYIGKAEALRRDWRELSLDRQRAIVAALIDRIAVMPVDRTSGTYTFNRDRLVIGWRF